MQKIDSVFDFQRLYYALLTASILGLLTAFGLFSQVTMWALLCLVLILISYCGLGFLLLGNRTETQLNWFCLIGGGILIFGGAVFDMYATYFHSPTLDREANSVARLALASNIPVTSILIAGFFLQMYFCAIVFLFWRLFLKSYSDLISRLTTMKLGNLFIELFAGPNRTIWALVSGRVDAKYALLSISPILTATFLYRWYLGLEWFRLTPLRREFFFVILIFSATVIYVLIAKNSVQKLKNKIDLL